MVRNLTVMFSHYAFPIAGVGQRTTARPPVVATGQLFSRQVSATLDDFDDGIGIAGVLLLVQSLSL